MLVLWLLPAAWSSNYLIARGAHDLVAAHALALGRWTIACALLAPFAGLTLWRMRRQWWPEWPRLLLLGALGMWVCGAFVYQAGHSTSTTNIALIYAATPIAIAVAGARMLHERLRPAQWAGMALALAGLLFVIARGEPQRLAQVRLVPGDLWIAVAAVCWAAYSVLLKHWQSVLPPTARLLATALGGLLVLAPFTALEAVVAPGPPIGAAALALMALAALVPGVLSYMAYAYLQRELGAARSALVMYLSPLYATLGAWALLGEAPQWYHAVGAAMILPSIALASGRR